MINIKEKYINFITDTYFEFYYSEGNKIVYKSVDLYQYFDNLYEFYITLLKNGRGFTKFEKGYDVLTKEYILKIELVGKKETKILYEENLSIFEKLKNLQIREVGEDEDDKEIYIDAEEILVIKKDLTIEILYVSLRRKDTDYISNMLEYTGKQIFEIIRDNEKIHIINEDMEDISIDDIKEIICIEDLENFYL